jgi:hypothetical protein
MARAQRHDFGTDQRHETLSGKARAALLFPSGIARQHLGHGSFHTLPYVDIR